MDGRKYGRNHVQLAGSCYYGENWFNVRHAWLTRIPDAATSCVKLIFKTSTTGRGRKCVACFARSGASAFPDE